VTEVLDGDRYTLKSLNNNRLYKYPHESLRKLPDGQVPSWIAIQKLLKETVEAVERDSIEAVERDSRSC